MLLEEVKRFAQVAEIVRTLDALHQHVVDVYLHGMPDLIFEHAVDHPLEGGSGILQSERYDL